MALYLYENKNCCVVCGERYSRILLFGEREDISADYKGMAHISDCTDGSGYTVRRGKTSMFLKNEGCIISSDIYCYNCDDSKDDPAYMCLRDLLNNYDEENMNCILEEVGYGTTS